MHAIGAQRLRYLGYIYSFAKGRSMPARRLHSTNQIDDRNDSEATVGFRSYADSSISLVDLQKPITLYEALLQSRRMPQSHDDFNESIEPVTTVSCRKIDCDNRYTSRVTLTEQTSTQHYSTPTFLLFRQQYLRITTSPCKNSHVKLEPEVSRLIQALDIWSPLVIYAKMISTTLRNSRGFHTPLMVTCHIVAGPSHDSQISVSYQREKTR